MDRSYSTNPYRCNFLIQYSLSPISEFVLESYNICCACFRFMSRFIYHPFKYRHKKDLKRILFWSGWSILLHHKLVFLLTLSFYIYIQLCPKLVFLYSSPRVIDPTIHHPDHLSACARPLDRVCPARLRAPCPVRLPHARVAQPRTARAPHTARFLATLNHSNQH